MTLSFHKINFTVDDILDIIDEYVNPEDAPSEPFTVQDIQDRFVIEAERLSHENKTQYDGGC